MRRAIISAMVACTLLFSNVAAAQKAPLMRKDVAETNLLAKPAKSSDKTILERNKYAGAGVVACAVVGTLIIPIIGTLIGAVVCGLLGHQADAAAADAE